MTRATIPFGCRKVYEVYSMPPHRGMGGYNRRTIRGYYFTNEQAQAECRGTGLKAQPRWAIRTVGGWFLLASVKHIDIWGDGKSNMGREIQEAITSQNMPVLINIIEGQAEQLNRARELLDRAHHTMQDVHELRKLVGDIYCFLHEVPDGHEDETAVRDRVASDLRQRQRSERAASRPDRARASDPRAAGLGPLVAPDAESDLEPDH